MNRSLSTTLLLLLTMFFVGQRVAAQDVFTVAESGDVAAMAKLLKKKPKLIQATQTNGETALHLAVRTNDTAMVALLLRNRAAVDAQSKDGLTPLQAARSAEIAELLIASKANINHADHVGATPLHDAAMLGHLKVVAVLLHKGAAINAQNIIGQTPLRLAVDNSYAEIVEMLLAGGADPNIADSDGRTPIFSAVQGEEIELTQTLINAGAEVGIEDVEAIRLDQLAQETGNIEMMNVIEAAMRPQGFVPENPEQPTEFADEPTDEPMEAPSADGLETRIALSLGANGDLEELKSVIAEDPEDVKVNGSAYILLANGRRDAIELLIANGASVSYPSGVAGTTALHKAAMAGDTELMEFLLSQPTADINAPADLFADDGATPLHLAAAAGKTEMVGFLLNHDADSKIEAKRNGVTPLHAAAENSGLEMVQLLVERGADVNAHHSTGESSPLHYAAQGNKVDIVRYLLDHDATIDPADLRKQTPLFWAVRNNSIDAARLLLERGANPMAVDWNNQTVIDYARQEKKEEFVKMMEEYKQ